MDGAVSDSNKQTLKLCKTEKSNVEKVWTENCNTVSERSGFFNSKQTFPFQIICLPVSSFTMLTVQTQFINYDQREKVKT